MGYIDDYIRYHLNPKYCEALKKEIIQRLKDDMPFYEKEEPKVDVLSHYDIVTDTHKMLVVINRTPLICLEIDPDSRSYDITWKVMKAYNERFGEDNGR